MGHGRRERVGLGEQVTRALRGVHCQPGEGVQRQFTDPWVVDDDKFRSAFGDHATALDHALETTVAWYRAAAFVTT